MNGISSLMPKAGGALMMRRASESLALAERDVLTRENALKASSPGSSHTNYIYKIGPDGRRYIVGAEVTITTPGGETRGGSGIESKTSLKAPDKPQHTPQADPNKAEIARLQQTEREVVAHENAHKAVAGSFGGPIQYTYTTGPDGKRYITGGSVSISTPATNDPEEALANARRMMSAALAPGSPSGQDIAVAAKAAAAASNAIADTASRAGGERVGKGRGGEVERSYAASKSPLGLWSNDRADAIPALDIPVWA